jgi:glutaredoxin
MSVTLLCLVLSISPALGDAKKHLEAGKIDDVFLALENQKLAPDEKAPAADLLARASVVALEKKDGVMALSLAELALKHHKDHPPGLEAAARASRSVEQFEQAEKYADRWIKVDANSAAPHVLRAELALEAADWQVALDQLAAVKSPGPLAEQVKSLKARAQAELNERKSAVTTVANLEKTLMAAAAEAKKRGNAGEAAPSRSGDVIVYSTAWCGYCRKAKAWLKKKGISYTEKDIEKDPDAAAELASKASAAGVQPNGVPVIDARGTLVLGFDEQRLDQLL